MCLFYFSFFSSRRRSIPSPFFSGFDKNDVDNKSVTLLGLVFGCEIINTHFLWRVLKECDDRRHRSWRRPIFVPISTCLVWTIQLICILFAFNKFYVNRMGWVFVVTVLLSSGVRNEQDWKSRKDKRRREARGKKVRKGKEMKTTLNLMETSCVESKT